MLLHFRRLASSLLLWLALICSARAGPCHYFRHMFEAEATCWNTSSTFNIEDDIIREFLHVDVVNGRTIQFRKSETKLSAVDEVITLVAPELCTYTISIHGFLGFKFLTKLVAPGTKLRQMYSNWFEPDNVIEYIDLSRNKLSALRGELFQHLIQLRFANFSFNRIETVEKDTFARMLNLEVLHLSNNDLKEVDFGRIPRVNTLNLRSNKIFVLDFQSFENMPFLENLDLSSNAIAKISDSGDFSLTSLRVLDLSSNDLDDVKEGMFNGIANTKLMFLNLSDNFIGDIDPFRLQKLGSVKTLDLSRNHIDRLYLNAFSGMKQLRFLDLSNNNIFHALKGCFNTLESLQVLNMGFNTMNYFYNGMFEATPNLEDIDMSNNRFDNIEDHVFFPLQKLRKLSLAKNKLTNISPEFLNSLENLSELELDFNEISFLPDFNHTFPNLKRATIEGNSWQCRCLDEVLLFLESRNIEYRKTDYFDGQKPACVVTSSSKCEKDQKFVDDQHLLNPNFKYNCRLFVPFLREKLLFYTSRNDDRLVYISRLKRSDERSFGVTPIF